MFRFWVLFTVAWLIGCGVWAWSIANETRLYPPEAWVLPSATAGFYKSENPNGAYELKPTHTEYEFEYHQNIILFVHKSIPHEVFLATKAKGFYDAHVALRAAQLRQQKIDQIPTLLAGSVLPPAMVFIIGYATGWAFSGFRKSA
jgi:hypothetical protein